MTWPDRPPPNMMERARDVLARRAEAERPGWVLRHGIYGWTATRDRDGLTRSSSSLPGLQPLMTSADTAGWAAADDGKRGARRPDRCLRLAVDRDAAAVIAKLP